MKNRDDDRAFVRAVKAEIAKRGFGSQTELAEKSGVSKSLINDIINGRTFGKIKTQLALTTALGYKSLEEIWEMGRRLAREERQSQTRAGSEGEFSGHGEIPSLLEILVENRALRIELGRLRRELEVLRGGDRTLADKTALTDPKTDPDALLE
jgi:transcriptional regulator with XRE-family HTH domain